MIYVIILLNNLEVFLMKYIMRDQTLPVDSMVYVEKDFSGTKLEDVAKVETYISDYINPDLELGQQ